MTRDTLAEMEALAAKLDAEGNTEGAADVRDGIAQLTAPRPVVVQRCDACGNAVRSRRQIDKYDAAGVDWVMCTRCETGR